MISNQLLIDNTFAPIQLLNSLIEKHEKLYKRGWDKFFVITEDKIITIKVSINNCKIIDKLDKSNIIKNVAKLLNDNDLFVCDNITDDDINIEFHYAYNPSNQSESLSSIFDIHQDDFGGTNFPVHTFICYKTINVVGGNFAFYDNGDGKETKEPTKIVDITSNAPNKSKVIIFNGAMFHCPLPLVFGYRYCLTVQIKKKEE